MSTISEKIQEIFDLKVQKIQELIEAEVQKQISKYAQIISKKHDISLKLLLQDIPTYSECEEEETCKGKCLGITANKKRCKFNGKHGGYCARHKDQKKVIKRAETPVDTFSKHVGHTMKDSLFLVGCPACEKSRGSRQNLLIEI